MERLLYNIIFPVKLAQLAKIFNVKGKISKYNIKFNDLNLFKDKELLKQFKQYSLQESKALFEVLIEAQKLYISNYKIDITTILSTLSLKIFIIKFLDTDISILNSSDDSFIKNSYLGGATDYYKAYITNGY